MIAIYIRYSTEKQEELQQMNTVTSYLERKGIIPDETVRDEGISGGVSYKNRNLYKLVCKLQPGDTIIVSEISRIGRSMSDLNKLITDELKPRKAKLIIVSMNLEIDCFNIKAIDEMILFSFSFAAQIEKELIQSRVKSALDARKKQIKDNGFFISKKGERIESFASAWGKNTGANREDVQYNASIAAAKIKTENARNNPNNVFFWQFITNWQKKHKGSELTDNWKDIVAELNSLKQTTATGLPFNESRARNMYHTLKRIMK